MGNRVARSARRAGSNGLRAPFASSRGRRIQVRARHDLAEMLGADEFGFRHSGVPGDWLRDGAAMPLEYLPGRHCDAGRKLRARFAGKPEMVVTYFRGICAEEVRVIRMAELGVRSIDESSGAVERLVRERPKAACSVERLLEPMRGSSAYRRSPGSARTSYCQFNRSVMNRQLSSQAATDSKLPPLIAAIGADLSGEWLRRIENARCR